MATPDGLVLLWLVQNKKVCVKLWAPKVTILAVQCITLRVMCCAQVCAVHIAHSAMLHSSVHTSVMSTVHMLVLLCSTYVCTYV